MRAASLPLRRVLSVTAQHPWPHAAPRSRQRQAQRATPQARAAGVDRRGHFQSVGDITTQQIFGLKRTPAAGDALAGDGVHVPLMALDPTLEHASLQPSPEPRGADADDDLWNQQEPDDATLDSWATLGFTAEMCAHVHGVQFIV